MDLRNLQALLDVVAAGSVQSAADRLKLPRSTLRRRLENLEAEVGASLLVRDRAGVSLTPAGSVVVEDGRRLLEYSNQLLFRARAPDSEGGGTVRIFVPVGLPPIAAIQVLSALATTRPRMAVDIRELEDPLSHIHEPFELLLHFGAPPSRGQWFSRQINRVEVQALASQAYLDAHGTPSSLADLANHRLLLWKVVSTEAPSWPLADGGAHPIEPRVTSGDLQLLLHLAAAGLGVVVAPTAMLPEGLGAPLLPLLEGVLGGSLGIRTLSPGPSQADARVRGFLESVQLLIASLSTE
jgi:DNA-binding transcriptional LysR family regulator